MAQAHRLDCDSAAADCRCIVQSENEPEAVELAKKHRKKSTNGNTLTQNSEVIVWRSGRPGE